MATKDFRASQIETSKIIGTGSISGATVGIAVYSGSIASNREGGTTDSAMFDNVGEDVFLFVSGSANTRTGVTLFGGDLVVSGTLYAERQVIEVDETVSGSFLVSGSANIAEGLTVNSSQAGSTESDFVVYGQAGYRPIFVDVSSNSVLINADADPITTKIYNNLDEALNVDSSGVVINEQSENTIDFRVETNNLQGAIVVDASHETVMLGSNETNVSGESLGSDVNLFFSGSSGTKDTAIKGTSVFAGDVVISGTLYPGGNSDQFISANGNEIIIDGNDYVDIRIDTTFGVYYSPAGSNPIFAVHGGSGTVINTSGLLYQDFRVESDTKEGAILIDAQTEQLALLVNATTAATAYDGAAIPSDIALFVSGAAYDLGSFAFGTENVGGASATFGGDLVVSGAIIGGNSSLAGVGESSPLILTALNGSSIYHGAGTHSFNGDISSLTDGGTDGFFLVSGSIGSRGTSDRGTAVFGGDVVTSGSLFVMTGSNQGIILQSPNGSQFYLTVDDAGNLSTSTFP